MLKELCSTSDSEIDDFVGLRFANSVPKVIFPRGYQLPQDDDEAREDIVNLISTIRKFTSRYEGQKAITEFGEVDLSFPIYSYQFLIHDFLSHGYYNETEVQYQKSLKGKTNWKRTIQNEQPHIDNNNVVYLNFIVKSARTKENSLISKIHEFCIYESFKQIGWLYSSSMPKKPVVKLNKPMFLSILNSEMNSTFDSRKKTMFNCMINVINHADIINEKKQDNSFGVMKFEYLWENLIDYVFGEDNIDNFFPHASWHIINDKNQRVESSALQPDTIMSYDDKIFILDAKYYKYGITHNPMHLPASSSIQKQITYGEYIEQLSVTHQNNIFNAFIMPFNCKVNKCEIYRLVSIGTADWKKYNLNTQNYNYVLGILLDTKHIISTYSRKNRSEINILSYLIENSLKMYRTNEKKPEA